MKKFSDYLGIDTQLTVRLTVDVITDNGAPWTEVAFNDSMIYWGYLNQAKSFVFQHSLKDPLKISVTMDQKNYSLEKETAVIVKSLTVDDVELIPTYSNHACYVNDRNQTTTTNYLGWNGQWTLTIDQPFYHWLHQVTGQGWILD